MLEGSVGRGAGGDKPCKSRKGDGFSSGSRERESGAEPVEADNGEGFSACILVTRGVMDERSVAAFVVEIKMERSGEQM